MLGNEISFLYTLTLSISGALFLLLAYLTIRKAFSIRKRKWIEYYKEKYNPLFFRMLTDQIYSREISSETSIKQKAIEELLSKYTKVLEGEEERKRMSALAALHLGEYYRKRLKSMRWSTRMNALYHIEDFHLQQLMHDVYLLTAKKRLSHEELNHILRILALFQYRDLFELLTTRYDSLSEYEYRNILLRLDERQFDQFVLHFHKSKPPLQMAILDCLSFNKKIHYLSFLENVFSSCLGEVRLRALKSLAALGYVSNVDPYLELLHSTLWEERMVAAKLIGALKEERGIPRLLELLHDSSWWVRSQAGHAISQFSNGRELLRRVLETSKDAFAKDMAWEWLHKGV